MNERHDSEREQALMAAARAELEQSTASLDAVTVARLRAARARALAAASARTLRAFWLPAAAAATVTALVAGALLMNAPPPAPVDAGEELMAMLEDSDELYENLEFYEWLEE